MRRYFITGVSGLVGGMVVNTILHSQEYKAGVCEIYALMHNKQSVEKAWSNYDRLFLINGDVRSIACMERINVTIDYIIHCAAPTASAYMISNPVETVDSIVLGTKNVLEFARTKNIKSMVYLSSMEVYGKVPEIGRTRKEEELGEISLDSVRSCYPLAKRMAEHYCYIYAKEYAVPVRCARLAQTFGKGVRAEDNRVYMQFARAIVSNTDIVLSTRGTTIGNYCAIEDAVEAIFLILNNGVDGEVYNVVNESSTMRIFEMAHLVAKELGGGKVKVVFEAEDSETTGYAPTTELRMSSEKLRRLGWTPTKSLVDMYKDVITELSCKFPPA